MISSSRSRLSYRDRRSHLRRRFRIVAILLLMFVVYQVMTIFLVTPYRIDTIAMEPTLPKGTRILFRPLPFGRFDHRFSRDFTRGDIVAIRPPYYREISWPLRVFDPLVRFFTLQRVTLSKTAKRSWENPLLFKRIIAAPGDTVKLEASVASVRSTGESFFLTEFETAGRSYDITPVDLPEGWEAEFPLSGSREEWTLGPEEYFVLGDNRGFSNDSRYWGVVNVSDIRGFVAFVYWPFREIGRAP